MNKILKWLSMLLLVMIFNACQKEPGIGGEASIKGRVYARHYNSTFTVLLSEYYVPDTYVYLVFGNQTNYGTRIKTNYDGEFEFNFLYPGDYTLYTYSIDSASIVNGGIAPPDSAVILNIFVDQKNTIYNTGDIIVYK